MLPTVTPSERAFNDEIVCVWAAGLYVARWFNPAIPATTAEVFALAADSGLAGQSGNFVALAVGMQKRYGLVGTRMTPAAALALAASKPCGVALAGDQFNLSPRYQSNHITHAIAVIYEAGSTGVQLDPLAPASYAGDPFTPAELNAFATDALVFVKAPKEENVTIVIEKFPDPAPGRTWLVAAGATVIGYAIDLATLGTTPKTRMTFGAASSAQADQRMTLPTGKAWLHVSSGVYGKNGGEWIEEGGSVTCPTPTLFTDAQVKAAVAAVSGGFTQADLDLARAAGIKDASAAAGAVK